ncbi:hypothetical protein E4K67_20130 [Desulfosporosinus fructosivorans]|uniref:Uncharacterized protein n=1 Tax=Desulfosporosinus fructosivorans TaxID=2018669 RepID=A0A4Z0R2N9_9FIRM|nr:hypothetical protein [Desulfosporosinus fructosivorans]TGE36257.1 hypothetical protein E4K67_20130 [Desulfosporosinus fructosivorans]
MTTITTRESGKRSYPIWLLVNPKHPAVRYYIWTPVVEVIQDKVYREIHKRIDTTDIFIWNVVRESGMVPNTLNWWGAEVEAEIVMFRELILEHKPKILITFGAFPHEFVRRALEIKPQKGPKYWGTSILKEEFEIAIQNFDINQTNNIPLLRRVVESGKFIEGNNNCFSQELVEHYFSYVGTKIAEKIIENKDSFNEWVE